MKKNILFNSILIILLHCIAAFPQDVKTSRIAPGIIHHKIIYPADTLIINLLEIDLKECDCSFNTVKADNKIEGLETTSSMTNSDNIIAAVNADFFEADGSIINNMISEGYVVKALSEAPYDRGGVTYSQIAFDENNNPYIEKFRFEGCLTNGDLEYDIYGINTPVKTDELILYNYLFDRNDIPKNNIHLLKYNPSTGKYLTGMVNNNPLSYEDFIILNGKGIQLSDTVDISLEFIPGYRNLTMLSGGWPQIIKNGWKCLPESEILERVFPRFSSTRHPRTGIGFSKDSTNIYLFVADGRQKSSRGMSLDEFADLMLKYGVYNALNLDGGGSSTMVINGKVVNNPSDVTGERKVGSAIYVKKKQ